ncbi:hypothetical protein SAMN05444168_1580 [Paraburkholderia phenazinium]|uniref:Uncharacterized protein n=2 Tax=Paraburkholderia phenazinium TaxID=60549 RepID=A0A1N6FHU2_9BURK|nr:hypothetical protein SAMN05444168_1580 [Paraburkholderia phenazinium]
MRAAKRFAYVASHASGYVLRVCVSLLRVIFNSIFPALVALIGALTGLWASVYSGPLKASIEAVATRWGLSDEPKLVVPIAIALFLAFFGVFALQQLVRNSASKRAREELMKESGDLRGMVGDMHSLPPTGFLQEVQAFYGAVANSLYATSGGNTYDRNRESEAVRAVLAAVAGLAAYYDGSRKFVTYGANVMLYRDNTYIANLEPSKKARLERKILFCDAQQNKLASVDGVLESIPGFSTHHGKYGRLHTTPMIVLPVPHPATVRATDGDRDAALPGGPLAIARLEYATTQSVAAMMKWCEERSDIKRSVQFELQHFFEKGEGREIKSFASIPLFIREPTEEDASPEVVRRIGVLNIHCTAENILRRDGARMFVPIIQPFAVLLNMLLLRYLDDEVKKNVVPEGRLGSEVTTV